MKLMWQGVPQIMKSVRGTYSLIKLRSSLLISSTHSSINIQVADPIHGHE